MANENQLAILRQGIETWNKWRKKNPEVQVDLAKADLRKAKLSNADLFSAILSSADLNGADLSSAYLGGADLSEALLSDANLCKANLTMANLAKANLSNAKLNGADLRRAYLSNTFFGDSDLSDILGLTEIFYRGPSIISTSVFRLSKGRIPVEFLRGCGLSDWEIEQVRLYNPDLSNEERNQILYKIYDLQASQAIQISPLFISYSHANDRFVDKVGEALTKRGIRYWRDIHDMKSGRMEKQIDRAIRQNPIVLLVLSEHSLNSDWVEHEVRSARILEKEMKRDVLCPVAVDDSWKSSSWPKRIMEQVMEYNILDFSEWNNNARFETTFSKLLGGLELFYK